MHRPRFSSNRFRNFDIGEHSKRERIMLIGVLNYIRLYDGIGTKRKVIRWQVKLLSFARIQAVLPSRKGLPDSRETF